MTGVVPTIGDELPTEADLRRYAEEWRFSLSDAEIETVTTTVGRLVTDCLGIAGAASDVEPGADERDAGRRPSAGEDPYNAIVRWCDVRRPMAGDGILDGVRIAVKDCIAVAGVPMTGGSTLLDGFVPDQDSTVVDRILAAGGRIVAVTNMDCLAWSGYGDTSVYGPTINPYDPSRTAGGSSGGSAAAVHYAGVDAALGCDQGGSIRLPASFCGVIGLKPSHGLVPYTRILGIDQAIDHVGPIARDTATLARLLDATAGRDPGDPRQPDAVPALAGQQAVAEAGDDLSRLRIGVVAEGLDAASAGVTEEVRSAFWRAMDLFARLGARVGDVSIPPHRDGGVIALGGCVEGMHALLSGGGNGYQWIGRYWPQLARTLAQRLPDRMSQLSLQVKLILLCAEHLRRRYGGSVYGTARNLHSHLRRAYDDAFDAVDVLALPTAPWLAHHLATDLTPAQHIMRGWEVTANTAPANVTGHPAISLPAAEAHGLPVGVMLVGRRFTDHRLLSIARTFEATTGWFPGPGAEKSPI